MSPAFWIISIKREHQIQPVDGAVPMGLYSSNSCTLRRAALTFSWLLPSLCFTDRRVGPTCWQTCCPWWWRGKSVQCCTSAASCQWLRTSRAQSVGMRLQPLFRPLTTPDSCVCVHVCVRPRVTKVWRACTKRRKEKEPFKITKACIQCANFLATLECVTLPRSFYKVLKKGSEYLYKWNLSVFN